MKVLKFGGSSVSSPDSIYKVARIIIDSAKEEKVIIVVSAFQGITNQLIKCARLAAAGDTAYRDIYKNISQRHRTALNVLHANNPGKQVNTDIEQMLNNLDDTLHGIYLLRDCPPRALDFAASFGEQLSARILASFINRTKPAEYVDARQLIVTDDQFTQASVLFDKTNKSTRSYFQLRYIRKKSNTIPIVTGFIAATEDGRTTTIGRNGSDYTASIIGAAIGVDLIEIWTDVDGVYSADPRTVSSAFVVDQMSYEEAMELSYFGAKVLHSATIAPAVSKSIPILIKNTFNPSAPGTLITKNVKSWKSTAKGISSVENISLLTLRGLSMVGVPGTAERLFKTLASNKINVILISQSSSEHTICFAINSDDALAARKAINYEFRYEFQNYLTALDEKTPQTIVAVVGEGMKGSPGVAGKVFQSLGQNNININAIAQGASERNISFVIDSERAVRALNVVHRAFFEKRKRLALIVVGVGNIGSALLSQIHQQRSHLISQGLEINVYGISNSKKYILNPDGINLSSWEQDLKKSRNIFDSSKFIQRVAEMELINSALVDCTASSEIVKMYPEFVRSNMHIITPNKKANVLPYKEYEALMGLLKERQKYFLYEANVGAGLPVISTLQDLVASGDKIIKVQGILSGTLSYLFNNYRGEKPFSNLVLEAHERGFTEPDPREDLSGKDVGRKLLILSRQLGLKMDLKDIRVENLVPAVLRKGKFSNTFFKNLAKYDGAFKRRADIAHSDNSVLRYVATLQNGKAFAGIQEIPLGHPLASTKGSDNIIAFTTSRYSNTPLVVQGPGAGADVTATGVFSDILKLLNYLPY
jgi:bifunctional aspartokinase / homoserine dehydrogenase 1